MFAGTMVFHQIRDSNAPASMRLAGQKCSKHRAKWRSAIFVRQPKAASVHLTTFRTVWVMEQFSKQASKGAEEARQQLSSMLAAAAGDRRHDA